MFPFVLFLLSDIATDGIKTRLAQIASQMETVGCVRTWVLEKLAKPNVKSHSLLSDSDSNG